MSLDIFEAKAYGEVARSNIYFIQKGRTSCSLPESSDDIILIIDPDNCTLVSFNSRLEKKYYNIDVQSGMQSRDIPLVKYDRWNEIFSNVIQQGTYCFEALFFDEHTPFFITCNSIYTGEKITWIIAYCKDISEIKDPYTVGHQNRVAKLAVAIAEFLHLAPNQVECVQFASYIHV